MTYCVQRDAPAIRHVMAHTGKMKTSKRARWAFYLQEAGAQRIKLPQFITYLGYLDVLQLLVRPHSSNVAIDPE